MISGIRLWSRLCIRRGLPFWVIGSLFALTSVAGGGVSRAHANSGEGPYFFATPDACASSWFNRQECANAFHNAEAEFEENAPKFKTRMECVKRFQQCESHGATPSSEAEAPNGEAFRPMMLGVEISSEGKRGVVIPVLAVANPTGMFHARQISRADMVLPAAARWQSRILPADRFDPFPPETSIAVWSPFNEGSSNFALPKPKSDARRDPVAHAKRLERLKSAPFIE